MRALAKLTALPLILALAFAVNAYASQYFAGHLFPRVLPRPYLEMMSAAFIGSAAAAAVVSWPLVRVYTAWAWLAALLVAAPVVALRADDLLQFWGKNDPRIVVMSWFELIVYPVALLFGVWLVSRSSTRDANASLAQS